ncbi:MAG: LUD domain-containing protein [Rhizobacter sp.]|nr:LUD domain-containing protein [Ferruginibacter sp.]
MISQAKENILKKIRKALSNPVPLPFPESEGSQSVYKPSTEDDAIVFAEEFTKLQGKFAFCANEADLIQQLAQLFKEQGWTKIYCKEPAFINLLNILSIQPYPTLPDCDVSITGCEYLVARTGSMVLSSAQKSGRTTSVYAPIHICIAYNSQLLFDIEDALQFLKEKYADNLPSFITFATGPSRTADIEKTLVTGVHGPKEVYCFLVEMA